MCCDNNYFYWNAFWFFPLLVELPKLLQQLYGLENCLKTIDWYIFRAIKYRPAAQNLKFCILYHLWHAYFVYNYWPATGAAAVHFSVDKTKHSSFTYCSVASQTQDLKSLAVSNHWNEVPQIFSRFLCFMLDIFTLL